MPIFPKENIILKPREQRLVKVEAPFLDKISGLAIIKLLDKSTQSVIMLKVKFTWNAAMLDMTKSSSEILILDPKEVIGILDLRSLEYYKVKQGVLQHECELAEKICDQFNTLINTLKKEQSIETGEKIPMVR